jgi:hypothetical protein
VIRDPAVVAERDPVDRVDLLAAAEHVPTIHEATVQILQEENLFHVHAMTVTIQNHHGVENHLEDHRDFLHAETVMMLSPDAPQSFQENVVRNRLAEQAGHIHAVTVTTPNQEAQNFLVKEVSARTSPNHVEVNHLADQKTMTRPDGNFLHVEKNLFLAHVMTVMTLSPDALPSFRVPLITLDTHQEAKGHLPAHAMIGMNQNHLEKASRLTVLINQPIKKDSSPN